MSVSIGTDPELFLTDSRTGGVVPVCGLIGGEKGKPMDLGGGFGVQEDNVMVEFNTPPKHDPYDFAASVREGIEKVTNLVCTRHEHLRLDDQSERLFSGIQLDTPQARMFGCSQDFDAYQQGSPFTPVLPEELVDGDGAWRFAGGHVHLGYDNPHGIPDFVVSSFADVFLGLPAVGLDNQPKRRALYGAPGRYRPTPYGIEYRVLSNFWVMDGGLVEQIGYRAYNLGSFIEGSKESRLQTLFKEIPWADVCKAISDEDAGRAADILAYVRHDLEVSEIDV
jgi:hypothetical protein